MPGQKRGKRSACPTRKCPHRFELAGPNVRSLAKKKKTSIETAAREARYSFFAEAAKAPPCRTIFLAHHAMISLRLSYHLIEAQVSPVSPECAMFPPDA